MAERKMTVEDALKLNITALRAKGFLDQPDGTRGTLTWSYGLGGKLEQDCQVVGSPAQRSLRLSYVAPDAEGRAQKLEYLISLAFTRTHFGRDRAWLLCPVQKDGKACNRRRQTLFIVPDLFTWGCRECYSLTYRSRQLHRNHFYESFEKPFDQLIHLERQLAKVRSTEKKMVLQEKIKSVHAKLKPLNFGRRKVHFEARTSS